MARGERPPTRPSPPAHAFEAYFHPKPSAPSEPQAVTLDVGAARLELLSDRGVFSHGEIDPGTAVLLATAPPPPVQGPLLDLGCGFGPIAVALAVRHPDRPVWAIDVNERARALTLANAVRLHLANVCVCAPQEAETQRFAAIYSNPPVRIGKAAMRDLLLFWLARLAPGGRGYLVVKKKLGADALGVFLTEQGLHTQRLAAKRGYRLLAVTGPQEGV